MVATGILNETLLELTGLDFELLDTQCKFYEKHLYIYIYIYKTETFEAPTIFHVSTILKK